MRIKTSMLAAAIVAAFAAQGAWAQADKTRAEVKAEARAAAKKMECDEAATMPKAKSDKARADVKAAAKGAAVECEPTEKPMSSKDRAGVKAETKEAVKSGKLSQGESQK